LAGETAGSNRPTALAEELEMSHVEYTREDSRKDLSASLMGLAAGVVWVLIVGAISYFLAVSATSGHG
jgi:hypothetical protein